jgi:twitching motility protein PilU
MPSLTEEQARGYITKLLTAMSKAGGSDLFVSKDFPPAMKMQGAMQPMAHQKLTGEVTRDLANSLMNERHRCSNSTTRARSRTTKRYATRATVAGE